MAQIPIGNFGQSVAAPQRGPRVTGADAGSITSKAVGDLSGTVEKIGLDQMAAETRMGIEAANLDAQTTAARVRTTTHNDFADLADSVHRDILAGAIPKDQAEQVWRDRAAQMLDGRLQGVDQRYAGALQVEFDGLQRAGANKVRDAVVLRDQHDTQANLLTLGEEYQRMATRDRPKALAEYFAQIDAIAPRAGWQPDKIAQVKQQFREGTAYTQAFDIVKSSSGSIKGIHDAREAINSDQFNDLDPQKRATLNAQLDGRETTMLQKQAIAEQRAANEAERRLKQASAAFDTAQKLIDSGIPLAPDEYDRLTAATSGTPYAQGIKALQENARQVGGFAAQPINMQQKALDEVNAAIAQHGASEALVKRRDALQKVLDSSSRDAKEDPLRAGLQRGVIKELAPIDTSSIDGLTRSVTSRLQAAGSVQVWAGRPVSPLTADEAKQLGDMLKTLPVQQRSTAIATLANTIGPQASSGLAMQLQPAKDDAPVQDRALSLAFAYASAKTTAGRYTSELILKGQSAIADKTIKPEKGAEFGWQAEIAKQIEGAYPNQQQAEAVKHAAYLITAGMATESSPDVGRAVRLAVGGSIVDVNGRRIPVQPGVDEGTVRDRLKAITANDLKQQAPDGSVNVGGSNISLDQFVSGLKDAKLIHAGGGRYNVLAGGRIVKNSAGQRISIEVNANAR